MSAVDEFTCRVEVTGVACCLNDHMQEDPAQVVEPPAAKQVFRPPGRSAVKGSGGNDGVGKLYLPPVGVQHRGGRQVRRNLPRTQAKPGAWTGSPRGYMWDECVAESPGHRVYAGDRLCATPSSHDL